MFESGALLAVKSFSSVLTAAYSESRAKKAVREINKMANKSFLFKSFQSKPTEIKAIQSSKAFSSIRGVEIMLEKTANAIAMLFPKELKEAISSAPTRAVSVFAIAALSTGILVSMLLNNFYPFALDTLIKIALIIIFLAALKFNIELKR